jgi:hypothetical protein
MLLGLSHPTNEQLRVDGDPDAVDEDLAHLDAGLVVFRGGIEIVERPGEHDLGQYRICQDELAEGLSEAPKGLQRVRGRRNRREIVPEHPESLEEDLPDEARLVTEDFVNRWDGGLRAAGDGARGQPGHALFGEHGDPALVEGIGTLLHPALDLR